MHQSDQVAAVDVTDPAGGWQQRAERAEARVAQLEARLAFTIRYLRGALWAVSDDEL